MFVRFIQRNRLLRSVVFRLGENRAKFLISFFVDQLAKDARVIDIGAGVCNITHQLRTAGYDVVPLDVENLSMVDDLEPVIYDGKIMPFANKSFGVGLLTMVLHHIVDQEAVLDETVRVSKRVIIIEDVYDSWFGKQVTFFFDSLFNLEFTRHPHSNKSDKEWKRLFKDKKLKLIAEDSMRSYVVFCHKVYVLET